MDIETKEVSLPDSIKRAMAKQAEDEREHRAKVVNAQGEFEAAEKIVLAAGLIAKEPIALHSAISRSCGDGERTQHDHVPAAAGRFVQRVFEEVRKPEE